VAKNKLKVIFLEDIHYFDILLTLVMQAVNELLCTVR